MTNSGGFLALSRRKPLQRRRVVCSHGRAAGGDLGRRRSAATVGILTARSRRGDPSPQPSSIQGSCRRADRRIDGTFTPGVDAVRVGFAEPRGGGRGRATAAIARVHSTVGSTIAASRKTSCSCACEKQTNERSGGCDCLHSVPPPPPQPWHDSGQLRAPVRSAPESGEIYR